MLKFREYVRAESLEDAYVRIQKKSAHILGGMLWLKMQKKNAGTALQTETQNSRILQSSGLKNTRGLI